MLRSIFVGTVEVVWDGNKRNHILLLGGLERQAHEGDEAISQAVV